MLVVKQVGASSRHEEKLEFLRHPLLHPPRRWGLRKTRLKSFVSIPACAGITVVGGFCSSNVHASSALIVHADALQ